MKREKTKQTEKTDMPAKTEIMTVIKNYRTGKI